MHFEIVSFSFVLWIHPQDVVTLQTCHSFHIFKVAQHFTSIFFCCSFLCEINFSELLGDLNMNIFLIQGSRCPPFPPIVVDFVKCSKTQHLLSVTAWLFPLTEPSLSFVPTAPALLRFGTYSPAVSHQCGTLSQEFLGQ